MDISSIEAMQLNLMPYLSLAPRKIRRKYGARRELTAGERAEQTKERNREHARHNRRRRTIFRKVRWMMVMIKIFSLWRALSLEHSTLKKVHCT
jgi:hypothetical protein